MIADSLPLRGFLAGLWSHTIFSALVGGGDRVLPGAPGAVHDQPPGRGGDRLRAERGCCDFSLELAAARRRHPGAGPGGVLLGLLIKGIPALVLVLSLARLARTREARFYLAQLGADHDPHVATPLEVGTWPTRTPGREPATTPSGSPDQGERAVGALQRAQCRYAVEAARMRTIHGYVDPRTDPVLQHSRQAVLDARERTTALGIKEALPGTRKRSKALWWALLTVFATLAVFSAIRALGGSEVLATSSTRTWKGAQRPVRREQRSGAVAPAGR